MESTIKTLFAAYDEPHQAAKDHDNNEFPIFGYITEHVPLELIHAADIRSLRIQGGSNTDLADLHLQSFSCSYARSAVHMAMNGDYDYLDGLISSKTCDVALSLFQIWEDCRPLSFSLLLSLPGNCDEDAVHYFRDELLHLKNALEEYRQQKISEDKIFDAIRLYNDVREVVNQLWKKRNEGSLALGAGDLVRALKGSQVLPPASSLDLLKSLLEKQNGREPDQDPDVRLLLFGTSYADAALVDVIERNGGRVVMDDTSSIGRLFGSKVEIEDDPVGSLARHYVCKVTGCYRLSYEERWERIDNLIKEWKINGCIHIIQKFCDTSLFESPLIQEDLEALGIPSLVLDIDDTSPGMGQLETRVQAFIEMVGGI
ncbi:2-hydroxyacyl-CoA dehydratase subunit D [Thermodesulfobacteriota bacterium]